MTTKSLIALFFAAALGTLSCGSPEESSSPGKPANAAVTAFYLTSSPEKKVSPNGRLTDSPLSPEIAIAFSSAIDLDQLKKARIYLAGYSGEMDYSAGPDSKTLLLSPSEPLQELTRYVITVTPGNNLGIKIIDSYTADLVTALDGGDKFPRISTDNLLTKVQQQTFKYFWDYAHPVSGLARERLGSGNTITTGGSGFGIMTLPVAVERGFVTRSEAAARLRKIVTFLSGKADRFHGAFPHWLNGETGKVIPFSSKDNGGDLVETAFLIQGLLTASQYFNAAEEQDIRSGIDGLWRAVEWDWYTSGGKDVLYWHWSPDQGWAMNMTVSGWNEGLMTYVLAASSPTHPVSRDAYVKGWARNGKMDMNNLSGPLFFTHYSFLGLDPRGLKDTYADYWAHNVSHARYNHDYCVRNPGRHAGYSDACWGLTASDWPGGYTASSPSNDKGTIAPTAALASFPYTPDESLKALEYFYYVLGDRLWGDYGFYDAFCLDSVWFAQSYIAIDQGPIVVMIENYRTGLLWDLFMKDPDVKEGLARLGFTI